MKKYTISAITILLILIIAQITFAQPVPKHHNFKGKAPHPMMMERLQLSEEQREEFIEIKTSFELKMVELKAEMQKNKINNRNKIIAGVQSRDEALENLDQISTLHNEMAKAKINMWYDVNDILNDTQKTEWQKARLMEGNRRHANRPANEAIKARKFMRAGYNR